MTIEAWYMDDSEEDQRVCHKTDPLQPVSGEQLIALGVLFWEGLTGEDDPRLAQIREERGYNYMDLVNCCPDKLPNYETKIKSFFEEHIHVDEEIRYCVDGTGYFDIRDGNDKWIRIAMSAGDMIIIPEGIYHRFTMDSNDYIKAMRLFVGEPVWTPYNRSDIPVEHASRIKYVNAFGNKSSTATETVSGNVSDAVELGGDEKRQKT